MFLKWLKPKFLYIAPKVIYTQGPFTEQWIDFFRKVFRWLIEMLMRFYAFQLINTELGRIRKVDIFCLK